MEPWQADQMTHRRLPSMTEVVYGKSKDTPVPLDMQMRSMLNNAGFATQPAATQNAVATASDAQGTDQPAYPTEYRRGFDAASAASTLAKSTPAGQVSKLSPDAGQPYPGGPQVENVTSRIAGMDSAGVNFGFPRFQQYQPQQVIGGGGGGMFSPSLQAAIQGYHDMSTKADDGSIAGAWRSRGFAKQRDRLLAGAANDMNAQSGAISAGAHALGANAAMMRAYNEPALEGMKNWVATRGQDLNYDLGRTQDQTHRYSVDATTGAANYRTNVEAGVHKYATDVDLAKNLPTIQRQDLGNQAWQSGQVDDANTLWGGGAHVQQGKFVTSPDGVGGLVTTDSHTGELVTRAAKELPKFKALSPAEKAAAARNESDIRKERRGGGTGGW